jgi:lysyl-tRNA synthetase class 2
MSFRQSAIRGNLHLRAEILQAIRRFFIEEDFLEVETPCRIPAPAPEAHIDAVPADGWFIHTSPELCMKRLLAAGYPRIFQICRCARDRERGDRHLPEFTLLEWYAVGWTYREMMDQCEALLLDVSRRAGHGGRLAWQGNTVDLTPPWHRMSVREAFDRFAPMSMDEALARDQFDEMIGCVIEPRLGRSKPLFLYDYPAQCGALARLKPGDPSTAERFELYICGLELCNAFTELTDSREQRRRFAEEADRRTATGLRAYPSPERFLEALGHMPSASGNALGVDRLVMLFAGAGRIDDVVAFTPEEL